MKKLNVRIAELEKTIIALQSKINDLTKNVEERVKTPYSKVGTVLDSKVIGDIQTGVGGYLIWNDSELKRPPFGDLPATPIKGYNKHGHSRYAGGALDINTLELVEYVFDTELHNKHCQQFFVTEPSIQSSEDSSGTLQSHIGSLSDSLVFDPNTKKWYVYAVYKEAE